MGIRKLSKKRAAQYRKYYPLREKYLEEHPLCEAGIKGCWLTSSQIHHKAGKAGDLLIDVNNFLACCTPCHDAIENEPKLAKENGHSKNRVT